ERLAVHELHDGDGLPAAAADGEDVVDDRADLRIPERRQRRGLRGRRGRGVRGPEAGQDQPQDDLTPSCAHEPPAGSASGWSGSFSSLGEERGGDYRSVFTRSSSSSSIISRACPSARCSRSSRFWMTSSSSALRGTETTYTPPSATPACPASAERRSR